MLLAIVLHSGSRGRVLAVGATFLTVTAGMYAAYVVGIYGVLDLLGGLDWIRLAVAIVAALFGLVHVKDYFAYRRGVSLSIPASRKPWLFRRMRAAASPERARRLLWRARSCSPWAYRSWRRRAPPACLCCGPACWRRRG